MGEITKTWLGLGALGAGLIHLAVAASAGAGLAIPLVSFGAGELAWGATALARDRVALPKSAALIALAPILLWAGLATVGTTVGLGLAALLPLAPMLAASTLDISIALTLAAGSRRSAADASARAAGDRPAGAAASRNAASGIAASRPWRFVLALAAGAIAVSLVTVPALAGTGAGAQAVLVHELHGGHRH